MARTVISSVLPKCSDFQIAVAGPPPPPPQFFQALLRTPQQVVGLAFFLPVSHRRIVLAIGDGPVFFRIRIRIGFEPC